MIIIIMLGLSLIILDDWRNAIFNEYRKVIP